VVQRQRHPERQEPHARLGALLGPHGKISTAEFREGRKGKDENPCPFFFCEIDPRKRRPIFFRRRTKNIWQFASIHSDSRENEESHGDFFLGAST
jgi:hypothetical protein